MSGKPSAIIPDGAFRYPITKVHETRWFGFLLLPEFTLLAFSSALDPLRIANQLAQQALYGWLVLSEDGRPILSSSGISIGIHDAIDAVPPDAQLFVCSGNDGLNAASEKTLGVLRRHRRFGGKVGGICTGAITLARAGLLTDKRFTLHWENQPGFTEAFPDLEPTRNRFEEDDGVTTCGGGSAATEMMLKMIAADYGQEFAILVGDMCLNDPDLMGRKEQRSSIAKAIDTRNPKILQVVQGMYANIEHPLSLDALAEAAGVSRRHIERQFKNLLGAAPAAVYRNIRLERGRALLMETDMSVLDVAVATGFRATSTFTRHFKARYGVTPYGERGKRR